MTKIDNILLNLKKIIWLKTDKLEFGKNHDYFKFYRGHGAISSVAVYYHEDEDASWIIGLLYTIALYQWIVYMERFEIDLSGQCK